MGDLAKAKSHGEACLAVWGPDDDLRGRVSALHVLALIEERLAHWEAAMALFREELAIWRTLDEPRPTGLVLALIGMAAYGQRNLTEARARIEEAAAIFRTIDERALLALMDAYMGMIEAAEGRFPEAAGRYRTGLRGLAEAGDTSRLIKPLVGLAATAVEGGLPETAARLLGSIDAQIQLTGAALAPRDRRLYERAEGSARTALSEEGFASAHAAGRDVGLADWFAEADAIVFAVEHVSGARGSRRHGRADGLTDREWEVLRHLVEGYTDREIAETLGVSYRTVTSYVRNIFTKLNVDSRTAAATHAVRHGLV
jgi:DNA-binding CsgD family transcriptional regulator